jgi:hypothetical protein
MKQKHKARMVVHICNPSTQEVEDLKLAHTKAVKTTLKPKGLRMCLKW